MGRAFLRRQRRSLLPPPPPDVDAVLSSLQSFSLSRRRFVPDLDVELNSDVPLPFPWEQVLNLQTGEIHYVHRGTGTKTTHDPRLPPSEVASTVEDEDGYASSRSGSCCSGYSSGGLSSASSTISTASSGTSRRAPAPASEVLVLVGCRVCLTLSMVGRAEEDCPKCGSHFLLHF